MSEALRRALEAAHLREDDVAQHLGVDLKTVRRWIAGRRPYPRHRLRVASLLGVDERDLWPPVATPRPSSVPQASEVVATYAHRWAVPRSVWKYIFESAQREICVLAYAGLFLAEDTGIVRTIAQRARAGIAVRILLGDPDGSRIADRGSDEGVGDSLAARIRNCLVLYRPLCDLETVELRLHDTVLYNSIYRADEDIMINPHVYGITAADAPLLHLRKVASGDMASTYLDSFESIWTGAMPLGQR
jgi:transcriptional regulator with XRE-family HTH domain